MEGIIVLIIAAVVLVFFIFIIAKVMYFRYMQKLGDRATQALLNNRIVRVTNKYAPPSESMLNKRFNAALAKKATTKFLNEHSGYTEESVGNYFCTVAENIINGKGMDCFSGSVKSKCRGDKKIKKMGDVEISTAFLMSYAMNRYAAIVIVSNGRDEYMISVYGSTNSNGFDKVDKYRIQKGLAVGL